MKTCASVLALLFCASTAFADSVIVNRKGEVLVDQSGDLIVVEDRPLFDLATPTVPSDVQVEILRQNYESAQRAGQAYGNIAAAVAPIVIPLAAEGVGQSFLLTGRIIEVTGTEVVPAAVNLPVDMGKAMIEGWSCGQEYGEMREAERVEARKKRSPWLVLFWELGALPYRIVFGSVGAVVYCQKIRSETPASK